MELYSSMSWPTHPTYSTTYPTHRTHPQVGQLIELTFDELANSSNLQLELIQLIELIFNLANSPTYSTTWIQLIL